MCFVEKARLGQRVQSLGATVSCIVVKGADLRRILARDKLLARSLSHQFDIGKVGCFGITVVEAQVERIRTALLQVGGSLSGRRVGITICRVLHNAKSTLDGTSVTAPVPEELGVLWSLDRVRGTSKTHFLAVCIFHVLLVYNVLFRLIQVNIPSVDDTAHQACLVGFNDTLADTVRLVIKSLAELKALVILGVGVG